jgi:methyl-accepting chemotaxis protein
VWALGRVDASPSQAQVMAEQSSLMAELREFVGREVFGAHTELDRSRRLIREAVVQLNGSFRSIEEQSRQQRAMISCLVEDDGAGAAAGSGGVRQFADSAATLMESLTQSLAGDSRESSRTAQVIAEMVRQLDEVFGMLGDLKDIAEQATRITREAGKPGADARSGLMVLTYEVRQLATVAGSLHERIQSLAGSSRAVIDRVRDRAERSAERGLTVSAEARARADELMSQVVAINRSLVSGINMVSQCGVQIRQDVGTAVRALQFEDIANQAMTAASVHVDRLRAINQDAVQLQQVLADTQTSSAARDRTLESFSRLLRAKRNEWRRPVHKPVSQLTMGAGSVELF